MIEILTKTRHRVSIRQTVATLCIVLGAGGLLVGVFLTDTNQPAVTCATIGDAELNADPAVSKHIRQDAVALTHAAADTRQANSVINRQILKRRATARKQQLRALIRANPEAAREMLLKDDERQRLSQVTANCVEQKITVTGRFEVEVTVDVERQSAAYYYIRSGETLQAVYGMPDTGAPISGSTVALTGYTLDGDFLLADPTVGPKTDAINILSAPALAATSASVKPILMLMGDFANTDTDENWPIQTIGETSIAHMNSYYAENSYGQVQWNPVTVHPWLKTTQTLDPNKCDVWPIARALVQAADPTVDFSQYDGGQLAIVAPIPSPQGIGACTWGGLTELSPWQFNTNDGYVTMNILWVKSLLFDPGKKINQLQFDFILNHEMSHSVNSRVNMGSGEGYWADCPVGQTFMDASCTAEKYYDPYDVQGGSYKLRNAAGEYIGWREYSTGHFTADRKRWLGWFDPTQVVTLTANSAAQTVDLTPIERNDSGVKMIRIQRPNDQYWTVEYRQPLTADGVTPTMDNIFSEPYPSLFTGALIHSSLWANTYLLDATPTPINDASDVTVGVGGTLTDPETGSTLTVISRTADVLRVTITPPAIDYWPPPPPLALNDGPAADLDATPVGTSLSANWSAVTDLGYGVSRFEYMLNSSVRGDIVPWTSNGTSTAVTIDPVTMDAGEIFYFSVRAIDYYGNVGESLTSDGVIVAKDSPLPAPERTAADGPPPPASDNVDIKKQITGVATFVTASWDGCDNPGAVASHEYALGTTALGTDIVGYTNVGLACNFTRQQLPLRNGVYYISIRAVDAADVAGPGVSTFFLVDVTPPAAVSEVRDGPGADIDVTASTAELSANWNRIPNEPWLNYYYKIGTTPGGEELVSATNTALLQRNFSLQNLHLVDHTRYYISVIAKDDGGNFSAWRTSDGIFVDADSDDNPPAVSLLSPDDNATVNGIVALTAAASDPEALLGVQFLINEVSYGEEVTAAPYTTWWSTGGTIYNPLKNGSYIISAVARDTIHTTTSASRTIAVNNASSMDRDGPWVSIFKLDGINMYDNIARVVSGTTMFVIRIVDSSKPITYTMELDGQTIIGPVDVMKSGDYNQPWDSTTVTNGKHVLSFTAHDAVGNPPHRPVEYTIFVNNPIPVDATPPAAVTDLRAVP